MSGSVSKTNHVYINAQIVVCFQFYSSNSHTETSMANAGMFPVSRYLFSIFGMSSSVCAL